MSPVDSLKWALLEGFVPGHVTWSGSSSFLVFKSTSICLLMSQQIEKTLENGSSCLIMQSQSCDKLLWGGTVVYRLPTNLLQVFFTSTLSLITSEIDLKLSSRHSMCRNRFSSCLTL